MYGVSKPFSDTCYSHGNIPLRVEGYLDLARMRRYTVVFLSKDQPQQLTINVFNCHIPIFGRRASYCTSYERGWKNLLYEPNYFDMQDETMLFLNQTYIQPTCTVGGHKHNLGQLE